MTSEPNAVPSTKNCTPAMPWLSLAVAVRSTVPLTVALLAGAVIDTVGGVVSVLATFTVTNADCVRPAGSLATAPSTCEPLATDVAFHVML